MATSTRACPTKQYVTVSAGMLWRLQLKTHNGWLCSALVDLAIMDMMDKIVDCSAFYVFTTAFFTMLRDKGYAKVSGWTQTDIFAKKFLFIPVNLCDEHWVLVIVYFPNAPEKTASSDACIFYLDSNASLSEKVEGQLNREQTLIAVQNYLNSAFSSNKDGLPQHKKQKAQRNKQNSYDVNETKTARIVVPKQHNQYDCALCVASVICAGDSLPTC